ncbi:MAG: N-acetylmuramoyl-L-alanine amidase [Spirochaetes bacterium]|nr:N-acetylmuramoyl-L-alanine amidase [Spirochaetota bacterium]
MTGRFRTGFLAAFVFLSAAVAETPLSVAAGKMGARLSYDPLTGTGSVERSGFRIGFKANARFFSFDGAFRRLDPIIGRDGVLTVPDSSLAAIDSYFTERENDVKSRFRVAAIVIDPGHGGKDPGAIGEHKSGSKTLRVVEKEVALAAAIRLQARLKASWPDREIIMTRDDDTYPTLEERVAKAHAVQLGPHDAVIFISLHANASFNRNANGFEVWYLDPDFRRNLVDSSDVPDVDPSVLPIINTMLEEEYTTESFMLAKRISARLAESVGDRSRNRGIRAEQWFVVRNARMPSVLVELGFVTEPGEAALLADQAYLSKMGDAVYNGIVDFVDHFENRGGSATP